MQNQMSDSFTAVRSLNTSRAWRHHSCQSPRCCSPAVGVRYWAYRRSSGFRSPRKFRAQLFRRFSHCGGVAAVV